MNKNQEINTMFGKYDCAGSKKEGRNDHVGIHKNKTETLLLHEAGFPNPLGK